MKIRAWQLSVGVLPPVILAAGGRRFADDLLLCESQGFSKMEDRIVVAWTALEYENKRTYWSFDSSWLMIFTHENERTYSSFDSLHLQFNSSWLMISTHGWNSWLVDTICSWNLDEKTVSAITRGASRERQSIAKSTKKLLIQMASYAVYSIPNTWCASQTPKIGRLAGPNPRTIWHVYSTDCTARLVEIWPVDQ